MFTPQSHRSAFDRLRFAFVFCFCSQQQYIFSPGSFYCLLSYIYIYMYIYIYIYIYHIYHHHHHVVRPARISLTLSLPTSTYHSSPLAGLQGYIPYHHIAAVCMFELVVLLLISHIRARQEYITYVLVLASPTVSGMSGSSSLDSFRDRC